MGAAPERLVDRLVSFALAHVDRMRLPSGLYCHHWRYGSASGEGMSVRYSLMVLLGLQRAAAAGYDIDERRLDELWRRCLVEAGTFTPGDLGLALWADSRRGGESAERLVGRVDEVVPDDDALAPLVGMEIAWLLIGLAHASAATSSAELALKRIVEHLIDHRRAASGLYHHDGRSRVRRRLPNFATEIYTLLALATLARLELSTDAAEHAEELAGQLLRLQLPDGGWPWLFDAERAAVVERYEIYSVHQDAMAPMALIELSDVTGNRRYLDAATAGLAWSHGDNELGVDLFDDTAGFAHRSIRRRRPWDRVALAANAATELARGRPAWSGRGRRLEVNRTCRPYHLGWILEAWAGREGLAGGRESP